MRGLAREPWNAWELGFAMGTHGRSAAAGSLDFGLPGVPWRQGFAEAGVPWRTRIARGREGGARIPWLCACPWRPDHNETPTVRPLE